VLVTASAGRAMEGNSGRVGVPVYFVSIW
jgi:hypothetical protein